MKNLKYIALAAFTVFIIGVVGVAASGPVTFNTAETEVLDEQQFDGKSVKNIDVQTSVIDVNIVKGNGDDILVSMEGKVSEHLRDNFRLNADVEGDTLEARVEAKRQNWVVGFNIVDVNLKITVPEKMYEEIEVKTATGDVFLEDFEGDSLVINSSTGDIEVEGYKGKTMSIETSTGDMIVSNVLAEMEFKSSTGDISVDESEGKLTLNSNTGDAFIKLIRINEDLKLETSTGDIDVWVADEPNNVQIDLRASTGDTETNFSDVDFDTKADHEIEGQKGSGGPQIYIRSSTGDINLMQD